MNGRRIFAALLCLADIFIVVSCLNKIQEKEISADEGNDGRRSVFTSEDSYDFSNIIIDSAPGVVYVGGVNFIFALDAKDIRLKRNEVHWYPQPEQLQPCITFIGGSEICQNYIRILHSVNKTTLCACGTMAYRPTCTYIDKKQFKIGELKEGGEWKSPYDSSTVSTMMDGTLVAATSIISSASGVIISNQQNGESLKTQEKDQFWLSAPQFVSAFNVPREDGQDKVFVLLKENAEEIPTEFLTQEKDDSSRLVYSRLATICKNDHGGNTWRLNKKFATFTKMRIACPSKTAAGEKRPVVPFYYDEIQDSFVVPNEKDPANPTLYAIFSTPGGAVEATATCVYSLSDIEQALKTNKYWNRPGTSASLYATYDSDHGHPPGVCVQNTKSLSNDRLLFGKEHPIKFGIIKPRDGHAVYQESGTRFAHIVVDRIKRTEKMGKEDIQNEYDVVHYITASGLIKRVVYLVSDRNVHWDIPSRNLFHDNETKDTVLTVKISNGFLYFGTNSSVVQLSLTSCLDYQTCADCTSARDPYCMWSESKRKCATVNPNSPIEPLAAGTSGKNGTVYCRSTEKKGSLNADIQNDEGDDTDVAALRHEISQLKDSEKKLNDTLSSLRYNNTLSKSLLVKCMQDRDSLVKNYTLLSTLILKYDAARKHAFRLYRNTIFSLHNCQHNEKQMTQKLHDEQKARSEVEIKASINATASLNGCEGRRSGRYTVLKADFPSKEATGPSPEKACEEEKNLMAANHVRLVKDMKNKIQNLEKQQTRDNGMVESCASHSTALKNKVTYLEQMRKNLQKQNENLHSRHENDKKAKERLKALYRRHGRRKNSGCERNDGWFIYEPAQAMFFLSTARVPYDKAQEVCRERGAELASLRTEDEIGFIQNTLTVFQPGLHYWVGLQKHKNGTLLWADGSAFNTNDKERFLDGQSVQLTDENTYCAEANSLQIWDFIRCDQTRTALCRKDYHPHADENENT